MWLRWRSLALAHCATRSSPKPRVHFAQRTSLATQRREHASEPTQRVANDGWLVTAAVRLAWGRWGTPGGRSARREEDGSEAQMGGDFIECCGCAVGGGRSGGRPSAGGRLCSPILDE